MGGIRDAHRPLIHEAACQRRLGGTWSKYSSAHAQRALATVSLNALRQVQRLGPCVPLIRVSAVEHSSDHHRTPLGIGIFLGLNREELTRLTSACNWDAASSRASAVSGVGTKGRCQKAAIHMLRSKGLKDATCVGWFWRRLELLD